MDNQRTILIIALAVLSWFLVMKWNEDYGQPVENDSVTISSAQQASNDDNEFSVPESAVDTDVTAMVEPVTTTDSSGLIRVQTDVISMAIDPVGGDIVELSLLQYPRFAKNPDVPLKLFENSNERVYMAQTALWGKNGLDRTGPRPVFSSTQSNYELKDGENKVVVVLTHSKDGVNYIKRFTLHRGFDTSCSETQIKQRQKSCMQQDGYQVKISYLIDNQSEEVWQGSLLAQIKRDGQGDPSSTSGNFTQNATYLGAAVWTPDEPYKKIKMGTMDDKEFVQNIQGGWVAWLQHYFVAAWVPEQNTSNTIFTKKKEPNAKHYVIGFNSENINIAPGEKSELTTTLYAGPKIQSHLKALSPGLELTVDYGFLWFIAQPIFMLLTLIHSMLGNWGWSIILLTVIIKAIFYPLSAASYKSMARMRAMAPKIQLLKEQAGDDRQKLSQGMMELYKKEKINPLGGCLPILVQMPVFLSLYWVLLESVEMRQVPWILWLTDLSSKDPYFVLPIIMGVSMYFQQRLNPAPPDPMQAKIMRMLPILFTFFFLWFPAGLVLYWVVNNILSIAQQWYVTRQIEKQMAARN